MTGSNFVFATILYLKSTAAVKTSLKSVFAFFYSLSRLFQLAYFVKCWRTLPEGWMCDPPRQGNVRNRKNIHKKGQFMGKFGGCMCFVSLIHTTWWDDIPYEIFFPVNCILRVIWLYFSPGWRAWHQNLRLVIEKWAFRNFQGWPKKDKNTYILRFCFKYTLAF